MTLQNNPSIHCDWPGCYLDSTDLVASAPKAPALRAKLAAEHGWTRVLGSDFCGHHPAGEHVPKLTRVTEHWTSGLRASCSCGWNDAERQWPTERQYAISWWERHLPGEDSDACMHLVMELKRKQRQGL